MPHPTEVKCPQQCKEFRRIIEEMYVLHLDKNQDYSPHNVIATGEVGLTTRQWDKMMRLANLQGFDIEKGTYSSFRRFFYSIFYPSAKVILKLVRSPKAEKFESIDDSLSDLANYCIIQKVFRKGVWGV